MNAREVLIRARALIAEPGTWTQGVDRRMIVRVNAPGDGLARCANGAISDATDDLDAQRAARLRLIAEIATFIPYWNDEPGRTQRQVLAMFDRAIAAAGDA